MHVNPDPLAGFVFEVDAVVTHPDGTTDRDELGDTPDDPEEGR